MKFVNLYFKSEYSVLQSSCKIDETFKQLKKFGYNSLAITDNGTMYGTIKFYKKALEYNIKPIIGLKIKYHHNNQDSVLLLYAMNNIGYQNLMKISSKYMVNNQNINLSEIKILSEGILCIIPFWESNLIDYYLKREYSILFQTLNEIKDTFESLYIGLSQQTKRDRQIINDCYEMFSGHNYSMIALNKISYLNEEDIDVYQTLKSIASGGTLVDLTEREFSEYLYKPEEIEVMFQAYPDLINNTIEISKKCNIELEFGKYKFPRYNQEIEAVAYLKELSYLGLQKRLKQNQVDNIPTYISRLNYELETIRDMGFSDYFLIVWDFIKFAKSSGIYVGPGRGSAASSLVSYSLGITDVDPIEFNLLFERFLNKERISMPDIDTDFPDDKRNEVIKYVFNKYGSLKVAHIGAFGTFKIKLALRDASRIHKLNDVRLNEILKCINAISKKELDNNNLSYLIANNSTLKSLMNNYEDINKVLTIALKMEGLPRNITTHPSGIIITDDNLDNYTPLNSGIDGICQTQYEAEDLESLGLLKMDFLGLRNLTNIYNTIELIKIDNPSFSLPKGFNDEQTFEMIASGDVSGVFQLDSDGMRKVLIDLKVSNFNDLASALALYRPGPMAMIPQFINRKLGFEVVKYPHPDLEDILKETYGTIVYQDQIMLIARKFAGYSLGKADILRRAVSKKKLEVLENERKNFVESSIKQGYDNKTAEEIYNYIVKFASYGFNKAHTIAYAKVSYQTAYLKCHYPMHYLATLMTGSIGSDTDIKIYYQDALKKGIVVSIPSINESTDEFIVKDKKILFPLTSIRGLGVSKVRELMLERSKEKFVNFDDFIKRSFNILGFSLIENVIYSGALDEFGLTKKAMIENYKSIVDHIAYDFVSDFVKRTYTLDEYSYGKLLEAENNALGINIKYNIINQYLPLYNKMGLLSINQIKENMQVSTLGFIQSVRVIKTKNNDEMAFIKLMDDLSSIELTLFPEIYKKNNNLEVGKLVVVSGYTQKRKSIQIVVNEIKYI